MADEGGDNIMIYNCKLHSRQEMTRNRDVICERFYITGGFLVFKSCFFFALSDGTLAKSLGIPSMAQRQGVH